MGTSDEGTSRLYRAPAAPPEPTPYLVVGIIGLVLFLSAILLQLNSGLAYAGIVRDGLAVVGAVLMVYGFARWNDIRNHPRGRAPPPPARGIDSMPSLEIYSPGAPADEPSRPRREMAPLFGRRPARRAAGIALLAGIVLLTMMVANLPPGFGAAPSPSSPSGPAVAAPSAGVVSGAGSGGGSVLGPKPTCSAVYPPPYAAVNGLDPPLPKWTNIKPCHTTHDEVHVSFASPVPGSGENVKVPIYLPGSGTPGWASTVSDFELGIVAKGDASSVGGQSYAEVVFTPAGVGASFHWSIAVAVWSLVMNTSCVSGLNLSYLGYFGCVRDDVANGAGLTLDSSVPGNQALNVTFFGSSTRATIPLSIYVNDSTSTKYSANTTLTAATTKSTAFQPYYATACPDACLLNWSTPMGLGLGVNLCDSAGCFSYNESYYNGAPPFVVGSPEYFNGLAYSGDYLHLEPVSSTGACSGAGSAVPCDPNAQAGWYPSFTFNGSALNFGANYSWATETFGGATFEFNGLATVNDFTPFWLTNLANSSAAGYVAPGDALNVTVTAQDLGNLSTIVVNYTQPGGKYTLLPMTRANGSVTNGGYYANIPSVGVNGTLIYRVVATNVANATVSDPNASGPPGSVVRSVIPTLSVLLGVTPGSCGGISVNGAAFAKNGTTARLLAGRYSVTANGCYPYTFSHWVTSGGVTVAGAGPTATLTAHANGTVTAVWTFVTPHDLVTLAWSPSTCGGTAVNGTFYAAGTAASVSLLDGHSTSIVEEPCAGDSFAGWSVSNRANLTILGPTLTVHGNGTLTANFLATSSTVSVAFATSPVACGGVLLNGAGYTSGESLNLAPNTPYPIAPDPCGGWGYASGNLSVSTGLTVANGQLTATGAGTVTFTYYKLTLVTIVTVPGTCGGVLWDTVFEPGGSALNVTNHTYHALAPSPCNGTYLISLSVTGNLTLAGSSVDVNGPGTVHAVYRVGTPHFDVQFITNPGNCGSITFDGVPYVDSQSVEVPVDHVATIGASPCAGYGFVGWSPSPNIVITSAGVAYINSSGAIQVTFHTLVLVIVHTVPAACGSVLIAGQGLADNGSTELPVNALYPIAADPCAHNVLSTWETTAGANVTNGSLNLGGAAIITAVFVPAIYRVTIEVAGTGGCGQVSLGGIDYANNTTLNLTAGVYPIASNLCTGYFLSGWATGGNVSVTGSSLLVGGSGTLTAAGAAVPPALSVVVPTSAYSGSSVLFTASVAVLVPPFDYNYTWNFGDGTSATTPANATSHTYASTGTYTVNITVRDPLGRTASAERTITIVAPGSGSGLGLASIGGVPGVVIVLLAVLLVLLGAVVAVVRARRAAAASARESAAGGDPSGPVFPGRPDDEPPQGPG